MSSAYARIINGRKQTLEEHLFNVAKICEENAKFCGCETIAKILGLVHDVGKFFPEWQEYLHAEASTKTAEHSKYAGQFIKDETLAIIPSTHHTRMHKIDDGKSPPPIPEQLKNEIEELYKLDGPKTMPQILQCAGLFSTVGSDSTIIQLLFLQTLYSILVDADRTDAANFDGKTTKKTASFKALQRKFRRYMRTISNSKNGMKGIRFSVAEQCKNAADNQKNIFELEAPTGSGKTFSALNFALRRCVKNEKERIIFVSPYQSIIKQTYGNFANIFGGRNILEYHSSADDFERGATWDRPIVVTTYQQFFESFFSFSATKSRKLRYMSNSVIVLDEIQMFPKKFHCVLEVLIEFLSKVFKSDIVVMSATIPKWCSVLSPYQIIQDAEQLYKAAKRIKINFFDGTDEELAQSFLANRTSLYVVNSRERAVKFHANLPNEVYLLTTLMHAKDREKTIEEIKIKLQNGEPCHIVATTLIDTGVDISVGSVYRDKADFGAMLQSFGRCNRHGNSSELDVYIVDRTYCCGHGVGANAASAMAHIGSKIRKGQEIDSLCSIKEYYTRISPESEKKLEKAKMFQEIRKLYAEKNFSGISQKLQIIDDVRDEKNLIIVSTAEEAHEFIEQFERKALDFKKLKKITISVPEKFLRKGLTLVPFPAISEDDDTFFMVGDYGQFGYNPWKL